MKTKRHILFITPGFPDGEEDSRCIPALQVFAKALQKRENVKISVIALHYPYSSGEYRWFGIKVHGLGGENKKGIKRFSVWKKALKEAKRIHQKDSLTHIQSFWLGECTWLGNKLADKLKVYHACTLMGQDVLKPNPWIKRIKKLPTLIALSSFHQQRLKESFGLTAKFIIPWGLEDGQYTSSAEREIDILGVGNLSELKNYRRFLNIVRIVSSSIPKLKVCLIGDGDKRQQLERDIHDFDLQSVVQLCGSLSRDEVLEKMKKSKVLLHCSTFESFGMVIIEALVYGLKVFSTPVGISAEIDAVTKIEDDELAARKVVGFLSKDLSEQNESTFSIQSTVEAYLKSVF